MKKFILTIAVIGTIAYVFASCNAPATEETTTATDSTAVVTDSTSTDTTEVISITNDTDTTIVSQ